jgi:hypothetical protein
MATDITTEELAIEELRPSKKKSSKHDEIDNIVEEFYDKKVELMKQSIKASKSETESS